MEGIRGQQFIDFIAEILGYALAQEDIDRVLSQKAISLYENAFTSKEYNPVNNYEMFEQLGDISVNKFIVYYMYGRFPQFENPGGVDIIAKLRIKYASKEQLQRIAGRMGMFAYISASEDEKHSKRKALLEDVFESFIGATEYIIDTMIYETMHCSDLPVRLSLYHKNNQYIGVGYNVVFRILQHLFDQIDIKLDYKSLVDAKTRLNELKSEYRDLEIRYETVKLDDNSFVTTIWKDKPLPKHQIGRGTGLLKKDSEEKAAEVALNTLAKKYNMIKVIPDRYKGFF